VEPPPQVLGDPPIEHKIQSPVIVKGWVVVKNEGEHAVVLSGGALKVLAIKPGEQRIVESPILESVMQLDKIITQPDGQKKAILKIAYINEWDALHVVENMIEEYARSRAYDLMSPEELRVCTLPLPKRALARLIEKIGVKAQRENESHTVKAG
jgi:hypothetical protein